MLLSRSRPSIPAIDCRIGGNGLHGEILMAFRIIRALGIAAWIAVALASPRFMAADMLASIADVVVW